MGEKDESKYAYGDMLPTGEFYMQGSLIQDDLIHDISKELVADADIKVGEGEIANEFKVSFSFDAEPLKKTFASTDISGDGIYAEYTYNGDKQELYEDVYGKITNTCHTEE